MNKFFLEIFQLSYMFIEVRHRRFYARIIPMIALEIPAVHIYKKFVDLLSQGYWTAATIPENWKAVISPIPLCSSGAFPYISGNFRPAY
jgi:hypothetical protein